MNEFRTNARQFVMVSRVEWRHAAAVKISNDIRKYIAEQGIAEEEALKKDMEAKSKLLVETRVTIPAEA